MPSRNGWTRLVTPKGRRWLYGNLGHYVREYRTPGNGYRYVGIRPCGEEILDASGCEFRTLKAAQEAVELHYRYIMGIS